MSGKKVSSVAAKAVVFDHDNPEWTDEDFRRAQPAYLVLPQILGAFPNTRRGPQKAPTKVPVSIRLSPEVIDHFKGGGPGWQTRIDDTLKDAIRQSGTPGLAESQVPFETGRRKRAE